MCYFQNLNILKLTSLFWEHRLQFLGTLRQAGIFTWMSVHVTIFGYLSLKHYTLEAPRHQLVLEWLAWTQTSEDNQIQAISFLLVLFKAPQVLVVSVWAQPNFQATGHVAAVFPCFLWVPLLEGAPKGWCPEGSGDQMTICRTIISGIKYAFWLHWKCRIPGVKSVGCHSHSQLQYCMSRQLPLLFFRKTRMQSFLVIDRSYQFIGIAFFSSSPKFLNVRQVAEMSRNDHVTFLIENCLEQLQLKENTNINKTSIYLGTTARKIIPCSIFFPSIKNILHLSFAWLYYLSLQAFHWVHIKEGSASMGPWFTPKPLPYSLYSS